MHIYYITSEIVKNIDKMFSLIFLRIENAYNDKNWTDF